MRRYGLIGHPLSHSFSKRFFMDHFKNSNDLSYENIELESITSLPTIIDALPDLQGFNVTAPYKEAILPFLDELDADAQYVGAVNTVRILRDSHRLLGYNTDIYGFEMLLDRTLAQITSDNSSNAYKALVLGTGGASKAVCYVLKKKGIEYLQVSRDSTKGDITYSELSELILHNYNIIINATPLGTYPNVNTFPLLPYNHIGSNHLLIDLVYNPEVTAFLQKGRERGAQVINGRYMLEQQALKAYEVWGIVDAHDFSQSWMPMYGLTEK